MRKEEENYLSAIDVEESYHFAKQMEHFKTNPVLGYRTAGSEAERQTGDMIYKEMEDMGLSSVQKDKITVDSWEFKTAVLKYKDRLGNVHEYQLGAYQTDFHTNGFQEFSMVYVGKGTAADYEGISVEGKLVLAEINQRDEWWINFPVYQAYLKGAAALIAVQEGGYGIIDDTALNAQDIGGPAYAPAFSISRADARLLKQELIKGREVKVQFHADTTVSQDGVSYNIVGEIPGEDRDSMILLSAHYDSYFSGFQDDNAALALMLGIGKALIKSGYQPKRTIVFCAMAAEEWGISDSKYDWSTGAWQQVFLVRPQWQGKVIANINFELPAHAHGLKDGIRSVYEYASFLERFLETFIEKVPVDSEAYPEGITIYYPVETMSDDFSMAIAGIPSMVNDFTSGSFMETHYHSQFDNDDYYEEPVFRFHHQLYGLLLMSFDQTAVAPLDFSRLFEAMVKNIDLEYSEAAGADGKRLKELALIAGDKGKQVYHWITSVNDRYAACLDSGDFETAKKLKEDCREAEAELLRLFKKEQDSFVRLNWHDQVLFPQEAVRENLRHIHRAVLYLQKGDITRALDSIYEIDNNRYAFQFDQEVFNHFTDYVMNQEPERLQWGAGRIVRHENLSPLVHSLKEKMSEQQNVQQSEGKALDLRNEIQWLQQVEKSQKASYIDDVEYMIRAVEKMIQSLNEIKEA